VVSLRKEVLNFRQLEEESLGTSWDHFNKLIITSNVGIEEERIEESLGTPSRFLHGF
jgi:hypothetical protein